MMPFSVIVPVLLDLVAFMVLLPLELLLPRIPRRSDSVLPGVDEPHVARPVELPSSWRAVERARNAEKDRQTCVWSESM